jgi:hypothetical protein
MLLVLCKLMPLHSATSKTAVDQKIEFCFGLLGEPCLQKYILNLLRYDIFHIVFIYSTPSQFVDTSRTFQTELTEHLSSQRSLDRRSLDRSQSDQKLIIFADNETLKICTRKDYTLLR